MNISAVGASYTTAALKPENAKQNSQTDPTTQQTIEGSDSFTKSAAADAALLKMKEGQAQGDTTGNGQQAPPEGPAPGKAATNKASSEDQVNHQLLSAARNISKSSATDETSTDQAIIAEASSSSSEYTAAEIAEYDTNGDGEISSVEEAKMKAAQAQQAASNNSSGSNLNTQMQSREAYQTAKWQMQAPQTDNYQFSYQV